MKLTILGNNGPFPGPGGACSGYLLEDREVKILIDCGNGVLSNLQKYIGLEELDAIILTHLHSDHMSDMMVLRYAVQIKMNRGSFKKPIRVYAPDEPAEEFQRLNLNNIYNLAAITNETVLNIGSLRLTFCDMVHPVKCYAISVENASERFVFSGDTAWTENIISFGKNADLLMLDAGLLTKDKTSDNVPHLTARECGIVGKRAQAKRLMLTHFWPEYNVLQLLEEAKENFENVELAELLRTYEI
jgi:ribonuclease BN (tRNA processing enzyme)